MPWYFSGACPDNRHYSGCLQGHSCYTAEASSAIMLEEWTLGRGLGSQKAQGSPPSNLGKTQGLWSPGNNPTPVLSAPSRAKEGLGSTRIPSNCF